MLHKSIFRQEELKKLFKPVRHLIVLTGLCGVKQGLRMTQFYMVIA